VAAKKELFRLDWVAGASEVPRLRVNRMFGTYLRTRNLEVDTALM
jgi:hypothetical protein